MTVETYVYLILGSAAGGFLSGLAGFGMALLALGFWLQVIPPVTAVSMVLAVSVVSGLQGVWLVRAEIMHQPRRLARFFLPAIPGIPLGVAVLTYIPVGGLKLTIAGFMLLYGGFFSFRRALPKFDRPTPVVDGIIGFLGGVLGGAASLSGALPTMWCATRPWKKAETRAVLQPYNVAVLTIAMIIFAFRGAYTGEVLKLIGVTLPVSMIFAQIGIVVFKRLKDDQFRRLIIVLMFLSGIIMMLRELQA